MNGCVVTQMEKSAKEASLEGSRAQGVKFHLWTSSSIYPEESGIEEIGLRKEIWAEAIQAYQLQLIFDTIF